jgi:hypothetical protein
MPRAARKKKDEIDPGAIYTAWQGGSCDVDGILYTVTAGERRRGSDPMVQAQAWLFVEDGAVDVPSFATTLVERSDAERAAPDFEVTLSGALPEPLKAEDTIQLTRSVTVRAGYVDDQKVQTFDKGTVFSVRSEIAGLLPPDSYEHAKSQFTKPRRGR